MIDRPRIINPSQIPAGMFVFSARTSVIAEPCGSVNAVEGGALPQLVLPTRLIVPATATIKRSLWIVSARKRLLLDD